jgi:hypothetical protein
MITLNTLRQKVELVRYVFYPVIEMTKRTALLNLRRLSADDSDTLSALVMICIIDEVKTIIDRKLINTKGHIIKLQLSDAQAIVLYKTLLRLPVDADKQYHNMVRNEWLMQLDKAISGQQLFMSLRAEM